MDYTKPWDLADVTFIVEDRDIYVNKATLSMSSDVFKTMFTANFAEKTMREIAIGEKKFHNFLELMQVVHPQTFKSIDDTNVHRLLPLSDEYAMHVVFKNCVKTLSTGPPSILSLNLAERYNLKLPLFYKKCLQYLQDTDLAQLKQEEGFSELNSETLINVPDAKVQKLEPLQHLQNLRKEVGAITDWGTLHEAERCDRNINNGYKHYKGADENCGLCHKHRFSQICNIIDKY